MTAIFLAWDPEQPAGWTYPAAVDHVSETGMFLATWCVDGTWDIPAEAEVWLLLRGRHARGLLGHGVVVSAWPEPSTDPDPANPDPDPDPDPATPAAAPSPAPLSVRVAFDALLPLGDQIPAEVLEATVPGIDWDASYGGHVYRDALRGAGLPVDPSREPALRRLWSESGPRPGPDATQPVPGTLPPEAVARVEVNRYERGADARRLCVARHGTRCAVCGFDFEAAYGDIGRDFIEVHHLAPPSALGRGYELDPVADLVPLCANCHAMAHRGVAVPRSVAELRRIMAAAGFLPGQTVSREELAARQDAIRILEQR